VAINPNNNIGIWLKSNLLTTIGNTIDAKKTCAKPEAKSVKARSCERFFISKLLYEIITIRQGTIVIITPAIDWNNKINKLI